jgi:hypothetical protein
VKEPAHAVGEVVRLSEAGKVELLDPYLSRKGSLKMAVTIVTGDLDLTSKSKRLASWHFSSVAGATITLRNGSVSGDIYAAIILAANTSASQSYNVPLIFPAGLFVDTTAAVVGSVDLI